MNKVLLMAAITILLFGAGCKRDLFEPAIENNRQVDDPNALMPSQARFMYGLIGNAYTRIPNTGWYHSDVATDNAVSNDFNNEYLRITQGLWSPLFIPFGFNRWTNGYHAIQYINQMLEKVNEVQWAVDPNIAELFRRRIRGEAYGLRAVFYSDLLRLFGGEASNGQMLGVPLFLSFQDPLANFNIPRSTYEECLQQIYKDLDSASLLLPFDYGDINEGGTVPAKFGNVARTDYNRVYGNNFRGGLLSGRIAMAVKAKTSIIAASPAFSSGNTTTWENAAHDAAAILDLINGPAGLAATGLEWYGGTTAIADQINGLSVGVNPPEVLWRASWEDNGSGLERDNYPPTMFGNGRINPTQNLVDAFPALNGYPISDAASGYNPSDPYTGRDPRLKMFVLVNGGTLSSSTTAINTAADGPTNDGLLKQATSTRTGYYLKKLMHSRVTFTSTTTSGQRHIKPIVRYTEIFLNYAEAANEAWGPLGNGGHAYSAYDVIKAIRRRAGIGIANGDAYLELVKNNKEEMRKLIRNERRLELCFEDIRFWDLRRWKENLTEGAKGVSITGGAYNYINVESRDFQSFMTTNPIPNSEMLKFNALIQNKGW
ncbi:RagB/SusD family nutrient uptake outer membrane protein [Niabella hibiscisoli]|uniref:RagB/SusD family nutrient uptake outer membrane protein n=1 Tax=Niabella hibiscisoli TaxID=1825928 RepID=UPI001F1066AD|nr:RagB/SusD family nutrient uptake outer membrane protein [Niabella hibiscisoli]MCH5719430.1 RagB/SusD family nutrient uptake outer membrane protein [Niabella hibiscisoli]